MMIKLKCDYGLKRTYCMAALHDETRARWEQYTPDQFIKSVLHSTLREKINTAYLVIHVYAQIIHQLPLTAVMDLKEPLTADGQVIGLRDLFVAMRSSIAEMRDTNEDDTPTLPSRHTAVDYILHEIKQTKRYTARIRRCAQAIQGDADISLTLLPQLGGKRIGEIAADILRHDNEIEQILEFSRNYVEGITQTVRSV
jgi:hypothetical protein